MSDPRYSARSASDKTENWPFWFVADRMKGGLNVTGPLLDALQVERAPGQVFLGPDEATIVARAANHLEGE